MLDLKLTEIGLHGDTADLYYNFYIDTTICDERICRITPYTGIAFDLISRKPVGMIDIERRSRFTITSDSDGKMKFPETPRLMEYLMSNQARLSPWLKRAAHNKGYI